MDRALHRGPFNATVSIRDGVIVSRDDGSVQFAGGESDKLLAIMVSVMGVESYPMLPARLVTSPFECRFTTQRQIELRRGDQSADAPGVRFTFTEGDDLIFIVKQATSKFLDKVTIKGPRPARVSFSTPDIPVEGR